MENGSATLPEIGQHGVVIHLVERGQRFVRENAGERRRRHQPFDEARHRQRLVTVILMIQIVRADRRRLARI